MFLTLPDMDDIESLLRIEEGLTIELVCRLSVLLCELDALENRVALEATDLEFVRRALRNAQGDLGLLVRALTADHYDRVVH